MKQQSIFFFNAIIFSLLFAWSCSGNGTYQYTTIEYDDTSSAFEQLHKLSLDIKKLFPKIFQQPHSISCQKPSWYDVFDMPQGATADEISKRAELLLTHIKNSNATDTDKKIATNAVKNAEQEGRKELPYKVFSYYEQLGYSGSGMIKKEVPHIALIDLVNKDEKKGLESFQSLRKKWKMYSATQSVTYLVALLGYMQYYINDDRMVRLKQNKIIKKLITPVARMNTTLLMIGVWGVTLSTALYPFYHFVDLFNLLGLDTRYPTETIDDTIVLLRKKTYSHSERKGNIVTHYHTTSEPLGYITLDEKNEQFKPIRPASKSMAITGAILGMSALGLSWVSVSGW